MRRKTLAKTPAITLTDETDVNAAGRYERQITATYDPRNWTQGEVIRLIADFTPRGWRPTAAVITRPGFLSQQIIKRQREAGR